MLFIALIYQTTLALSAHIWSTWLASNASFAPTLPTVQQSCVVKKGQVNWLEAPTPTEGEQENRQFMKIEVQGGNGFKENGDIYLCRVT